FFFFSSRRRHTRFSRDWSSDVCSSDLFQWGGFFNKVAPFVFSPAAPLKTNGATLLKKPPSESGWTTDHCISESTCDHRRGDGAQIGRASCRERGVREGHGGA